MKYLLFVLSLSYTQAIFAFSVTYNSAEVKIGYPCDALDSLPLQKKEEQIITFHEMDKNLLYLNGYILRKRTSIIDDLTIKYRPIDGAEIMLDELIYSSLLKSSNGQLKCELDMSYDPVEYKTARSCSFKSPNSFLIQDHLDFIRMLKRPFPTHNLNLQTMKLISVKSTAWKLKLKPHQSNLSNSISVERWVKGKECRLEISSKLDIEGMGKESIHIEVMKAFDFIKSLVKKWPSESQGNKTAWVLGLE